MFKSIDLFVDWMVKFHGVGGCSAIWDGTCTERCQTDLSNIMLHSENVSPSIRAISLVIFHRNGNCSIKSL